MQNKTYKLGVIGGMGSKATDIFFEKLIDNTDANCDQEHINTVILNHATMPDRTSAIKSKEYKNILENLFSDIKLLEQIGVSNIAIPCNTSHFFYKDMQAKTTINIINMIHETADIILKKYAKNSKVLVLGTDGTISSDIYKKELDELYLDTLYPDKDDQQKIMDIIYNIKKDKNIEGTAFENLLKKFKNKYQADCLVLACTELSTIPNNFEYVIDAMDALVLKSIELSGARLKILKKTKS